VLGVFGVLGQQATTTERKAFLEKVTK